MAWSKIPIGASNIHGGMEASVKILVDYNDSTANRSSALLEVKDYVLGQEGSDNTLSVNASTDTDDFTLTESTDFDATTSNSKTAENIATAIDNMSNYSAKATATGASGNPYVSVYYSNGHIDGTTTGDSGAWDWVTVNGSAGIAAIAADDTGTVKHQPVFTNSDGRMLNTYIEGPDGGKVDLDLVPSKAGISIDSSYTEDVSIPT